MLQLAVKVIEAEALDIEIILLRIYLNLKRIINFNQSICPLSMLDKCRVCDGIFELYYIIRDIANFSLELIKRDEKHSQLRHVLQVYIHFPACLLLVLILIRLVVPIAIKQLSTVQAKCVQHAIS